MTVLVSPIPTPRAGSAALISADLLVRVRAEYLEMPGLRLDVAQAARLFGLEREVSRALLIELVARGFLVQTSDGRYRRVA